MYIKGEALVGAVTVAFTVSGKKREWKVAVSAPGVALEDETVESHWLTLWTELINEASETVKRKRAPAARPEAAR